MQTWDIKREGRTKAGTGSNADQESWTALMDFFFKQKTAYEIGQ